MAKKSIDLASLTAIEVEKRRAFEREVSDAAGNPEKLAAIGAKEVRRGTRVLFQKVRRLNLDKVGSIREFFAAHNARLADRPSSLDELLAWLREEADEAFAAEGLPIGSPNYWLEMGAKPSEWSRWHGEPRPLDQEAEQISLPSEFPRYGNFADDHSISHAGRLHLCILMLEGAAKSEPVDVLQIAIHAMEAQDALNMLRSVTAKRRASGLTDAEAVFKGEDAKARDVALINEAAKKRRQNRQPTLDAARKILMAPGNRHISFASLKRELADDGFEHDSKALLRWVIEGALMVPRGQGQVGYKPNPTLFTSKLGGG